ncbi:hypothetical protein NOVOSPHI9U_420476 [Novosphingobium sp. 9U]|nr:hypothetical protein NOVOSPHI9U_420476 [Novosphingobium sp. 9U]
MVLDRNVAAVALGDGDDSLTLGLPDQTGVVYDGTFDGGAGNDVLRFASTGRVTIGGTVAGFVSMSLASNELVVEGTLDLAGDMLTFAGNDAQTLRVGLTGVVNGTIDMGAGDDLLELGLGATLNGTVSGGDGYDTDTVALAGARTLTAGVLPASSVCRPRDRVA